MAVSQRRDISGAGANLCAGSNRRCRQTAIRRGGDRHGAGLFGRNAHTTLRRLCPHGAARGNNARHLVCRIGSADRCTQGLRLEAQRQTRQFRFRRANFALCTPCLDLLQHFIGTAAFDEIGTVQLAVLQIDEEAVSITEVAVAAGGQTRAARQGAGIHLQRVALRRQAAVAVLAFRVGHHPGAIIEVEAHSRNADFFAVLHVIVVAVHEDLAQHAGLIGEHTTGDTHAVLRRVGGHSARVGIQGARVNAAAVGGATVGLGAVDAVALHRAHADPHTVGQQLLLALADAADVEHQSRAGLAERIGNAATVHPRRAVDVSEAWRQIVDDVHRLQRFASGLADTDGVQHRVTHLDHLLVTGFADHQARCHRRIQRQVVMDDVGCGRSGKQAQEVLGTGANRRGRRGRLRLHLVGSTRYTRRRQTAGLRRNQRRTEGIAGRRRHRQLELAAAGRGRPQQELVVAIAADRHRDLVTTDAVATLPAIKHTSGRVIARTHAYRRQGHDRTLHRVACHRVIDQTTRVHRQTLLRQVLASTQHHFQLGDAVAVDAAGAAGAIGYGGA